MEWLGILLAIVFILWLWPAGRRRLSGLFRRQPGGRLLRGRVTAKEGFIRPNVLHGGGGYRVVLTDEDRGYEVFVADYEVYQRLPEGRPVVLQVEPDAQQQLWLTGFRPG